ncbi:histone-lysine N-methyltransferase SUVR4-like [Neltuma alba]|uniref:histone-lysine N-methyltransferase SUVR4-like n=1 Tax=Neltuma alba TaxID=207710 RepID=UPI0010A55BE4|nr:histone-lysine N-methyltransferase SUVR4-like [Prosopis alba]
MQNPNSRVAKAFSAMKDLGISCDEVKPVLQKLLRLYDKKWEYIEEDNYRTLVDAYFELKEDKEAGGKRIALVSHHAGERQTQSLADEDDMLLLTTDNSRQIPSAENNKTPLNTFGLEITESSQPLTSNMRPKIGPQSLKTRINEIEKISELPGMATTDRKSNSKKESSERRGEEPADKPRSAPIRRENVPNGHYRKEILKTKTGQNKFHLGSSSTRSRDNNNPRSSKANIDIASSSSGEVNVKQKRSHPELNHANILTNGPQQAVAQDERKLCQFLSDITKGSEKVKISLIDEYGSGELPKFNYIPHNLIYQSANVNISLARIADEGCCSDCLGDCLSQSLPCACAQETGGEFAYTLEGLLKDEFLTSCLSMKKEPQAHHLVYCQECPLERSKNEYMPEQCKGHLIRRFIKECWRKCGCDMQCGNRIVQRGLRCKLQVFFTGERKGWGLRTLEDLPRGSFVCEYVGEILTNMELYERIVHKNGNERHTYPVTLDADWGSEGVLEDEEALCLDATYNGNVARFINHRCSDANLIDIPVEVETPDRHYYHLAFFTNRKVRAYEELTWDYGIDFDDHDHPIKAFQCCCGSSFCRNKKWKGKRKLVKRA